MIVTIGGVRMHLAVILNLPRVREFVAGSVPHADGVPKRYADACGVFIGSDTRVC